MEYTLEQLGFFSEDECIAIAKAMDGKTFMDFKVLYSNMAGNCTLIVRTDYGADEEYIKTFFISCAMRVLAELVQRGEI